MKKKEYTLYSDKISNNKSIAIVSDLHISEDTSTEKLVETLDTLNRIKPTHIVIPGDLYNMDMTTMFYGKVTNFINDATDIAPVIYVKGDSEDRGALYNMEILPKGLENEKNPNFHILNEGIKKELNSTCCINGVSFSGLKLSQYFYTLSEINKAKYLLKNYKNFLERLSKRNKNLDLLGENELSVLLCHDPSIIDAMTDYNFTEDEQLQFDLMISGHNHGGLYPEKLRTLFNLLGKDELFPFYRKGIFYTGDNQCGIVSEGITKYPSNMDIMKRFEKFQEGTIENIRVLKK